jgi:RND family efflux transporter MFP subunit
MQSKIITFLILLISAATMTAQEWQAPPAPVEVGTVENTRLASSVNIPANVMSKSYAWLSAETTGKLFSILDIGTPVKKGDVIAVLNTTTLKSMRTEQASSVDSAAAQISYLRNQVARLIELRSKNIAAISQLEETQSQLDVAISNKAAAQARLNQVDIGLAASKIRAPFDGVITEQGIKQGEWASPGAKIIRVVDLNSKEVVARTALSNIRFIKKGDTLRLSDNQNSGAATVIALVPFGNIIDGVYELRMSLDSGAWLVGENIIAQVPQSKGETTLSVPRDAIILRASGSTVIKVNPDNSFQRIQVSTGVGNGDRIAVTPFGGTLNIGDKVIVRGGERLQDGQQIQIKN